MKIRHLILLTLLISVSGCTPPLLQCFLKFTDYEKTYEFDFSKEELKKRIVDAYTYDKSLLLKNFGLTLIESEAVNSEYRKSVEVWLDKKNWDDVKSEIRNNTADTLNLLIGKHHNRKQIKLLAIIDGDNDKSKLTILNIEYQRRRACEKDKDFYKLKISSKIDKKLIEKINTAHNNAYSLWRVNVYQQGFHSVASFGLGGKESASKPPQAICKT